MPRRLKKWHWAVLIVAVSAGFLYIRSANKSLEVRTEPVGRRVLEITVTATATGTVKSDTEVKVTAQRTGKINRIHVVEGDIVQKKDLIAELDPVEAQINLNRSQASLDRARSVSEEMKSSFEALQAEVQAAIDRTTSRLADTEQRYENLTELYGKGFVSKLEFDAVKTEYEVAKAEHESALAGRAKVEARRREMEAQASAVKETEEALKLAKLEYDYSFLRSPINGVVTSVPVKLGETVSKGSLVAELIETESLYVEAFIDEADVGKVKLGQEAYVTMDAYPGRELKGRVYMISPVVLGERQETRTFEARTRVLDEHVKLKPGMSADIEIIVGRVENTLSVPSQAVIERAGKHYVFVKNGSRARLREVKTGLFNWTLTEITSGLEESDVVITTPDVKGLEDGSRVSARE